MADTNSFGGLTETVTLNLRNRTKILKDNISNSNGAFIHMKAEGSFESVSGGRTLIEEMMFAEAAGFKWYYDDETLSTQYNQTMTSAEFNWKQCAVGLPFTGLRMRINEGPEGVIKLVSSVSKVGELTIMNKINASFFADGTGTSGKEPGGLPLLVSKTPTTGTVGGIDRSNSSAAFYRNYSLAVVSTFGAALSAANALPVFNRVVSNTTREGTDDGVQLWLLGKTYWEAIAGAAQAKQHIVQDAPTAKLGYKSVVYATLPCYLAGGVNLGGETLIGDTEGYALNPKYLKLKYHSSCFMDPLEMRYSINQDAEIKYIAAMYNFTLSYAAGQARVYDS